MLAVKTMMETMRTPIRVRGWSKLWDGLDDRVKAVIRPHLLDVPVKVSRICADFGVPVSLAPLPTRISGEIRPDLDSAGGFKIRINRFESSNRQRFTAAHELAHFLLHRDLIGDGIVDNVLYRSNKSNVIEAEANRFAADLLMPFEAVKSYLNENVGSTMTEEKLANMAERFGVSEMAMRYRLDI